MLKDVVLQNFSRKPNKTILGVREIS